MCVQDRWITNKSWSRRTKSSWWRKNGPFATARTRSFSPRNAQGTKKQGALRKLGRKPTKDELELSLSKKEHGGL